MGPSDEMLAADTLKGNLDAFEELVGRYQKPVFRVAYRMMGNHEEAEDVAQEVFINVYNKMYQFDPSKKFAPWLFKITTNTCISRLRRKKKVVLLNFEEAATRQIEYEHSDYIDPLANLERAELRETVNKAMLEMPETYRAIIILRYQMDLTNSEIAETLGITRENVEVKMHRARKMLRGILASKLTEGGINNGLQAGR
ncbi:MAG: RNA polymerase sigma factor [Candidatus Saccharibacteria bacterium]